VQRGQLGVVIQGMDEDLAKAVGLDRPKGALVGQVVPGSPGEKAGLKAGDVILSVDGRLVPHMEDLPRMIAPHQPGTNVSLQVWRDRAARTMTVTLAPLKDETAHNDQDEGGPAEPGAKSSSSSLGIAVGEQDGQVVVERVRPDGPADGKLRRGDVIEEINHQPVTTALDFGSKVKAAPADKPVLLRVKRGDQSRYIAIERAGS
jgi:serine protease Do